MKLVVSSIALSLDDITETDGQKMGIFNPIDRNKVDSDYATQQIVSIIRKHHNSFLPAQGAFSVKMKKSNNQFDNVTQGTETPIEMA